MELAGPGHIPRPGSDSGWAGIIRQHNETIKKFLFSGIVTFPDSIYASG
jgi:hypothetical protein